ncbi:MAG: hypothetical protein M3R02_21315 [Chloroflexota bacterium]|nr:hypothetical protein [Chloroflexota bacterium]
MITVPVLPVDANPTPDVARALTAMAVSARTGDPDALATRYIALEPKITRFVRRYRGWERASWDAEDVSQEASLALARLLEQWSGEGLFLPYFFSTFRFRLRDAVATLDRAERCFMRSPHVMGGISFRSESERNRPGDFWPIVERLGVTRRTVHRRWSRLRLALEQIAA